MKISHLRIHNYKSIRAMDVDCGDMNILVGPNNHGKSNVLSAIEFVLSTSVKPTFEDFFVHRDEDSLWVELTFDELTEQEKNTFKRYVRADQTVRVRKSCILTEGEPETNYNGYVEEPEQEWLKSANVGSYISRAAVSETPLNDLVPDTGRLTNAHIENAQIRYIEAHRAELVICEHLENEAVMQTNTNGLSRLKFLQFSTFFIGDFPDDSNAGTSHRHSRQ